jgi:hypothetical protein
VLLLVTHGEMAGVLGILLGPGIVKVGLGASVSFFECVSGPTYFSEDFLGTVDNLKVLRNAL